MNRKTGRWAGAVGMAAVLAACSAQQDALPTTTRPGLPPGGSGLGNPQSSRIYRLGIGDKIKVTVFGEPDLSGQFEVSATGTVALPLAGEIPAKGMSTADVRDAIALKLRGGYLKDPKISVEVITYRPFFVHGEVRSGGEFAFKNGVTIRDAVAIAGGYTYRADVSHVLLIREGTAQEVQVRLPSSELVMPGDNIRVPERFF